MLLGVLRGEKTCSRTFEIEVLDHPLADKSACRDEVLTRIGFSRARRGAFGIIDIRRDHMDAGGARLFQRASIASGCAIIATMPFCLLAMACSMRLACLAGSPSAF
jgi:hypothetical protein